MRKGPAWTILCDGVELRVFTTAPGGITLTRETVQAAVPYPVKLPTYLPPTVCAVDFDIDPSEQTVVWYATGLRLLQSPADRPAPNYGLRTIDDAPATPITVNGQAGLWIQGAPADTEYRREGPTSAPLVAESTSVAYENILLWTQDGMRYEMRSTLPQAELLKVAASLQ